MENNTTDSISKEVMLFRTMNNSTVDLSTFIIAMVRIILALTILILNGIVIWTMMKHHQYRDIADRLVIGLSISSAGTGMCLLAHITQNLVNYQSVEECLIRYGLKEAFLLCSGLHLVCLTIDRFCRITLPFGIKALALEKKRAIRRFGIPFLWLVSIILGLLPIFGWNNRDSPIKDDDKLCSFFRLHARGFLWLFLAIIATLTLASLVLYISIFGVAHKHFVSVTALAAVNTYRAAARYSKTVFVLVGVYILCWIPFYILVISVLNGHLDHVSNSVKDMYLLYTFAPVYFTSIYSPIIYASANTKVYRHVTSVILNCRTILCPQRRGSVLKNTHEVVVECPVEE